MKQFIFVFALGVVMPFLVFAEDAEVLPEEYRRIYRQNEVDTKVPLSNIFHNIGQNALHSVTFNCGLNFVGAGFGTWILIETGVDWKWRNTSYNNEWLSNLGRPELYIGYLVPAITPVITYAAGRFMKNEKLQITGLALAQSLILTLAIQTPLKMITGRAIPGIITEFDQSRSLRTDNFSDEFNWFNLNFIGGWPSGHTANAFSAAATIAEIYQDHIALQIAAYSYAAIIGLGVSLNVHWASDVLAGALIGYAVGKTVGRSFNKLLNNTKEENKISLYFTPRSIGVKMVF